MLKVAGGGGITTGALTYAGTWDANANSPTLTSSVGTLNNYYVVSVAGNTVLNGIGNWQVGDWAIFNGTVWEKVSGNSPVQSVNGKTGVVVLGPTDVGATPNTAYVLTSGLLSGGGQLTGNVTVNLTSVPVANVPGAVTNTTTVSAGGLLTGGGNLASNVTISLANVPVANVPGAVPNTTTITAAGLLSGGGNLASNVTISLTSVPVANVPGAVPNTVNVLAGTGLTGGGPLTGNVTIGLSTPVNIANGGTNGNATPTAGAVAYGTGTAYGFTAAGTAGQFLQSTGAGTPTWSTPSSGTFQPAYYGTYVSTVNQTNGGSTTANPVAFDTPGLFNGVSISNGNQITFANAGTYLVEYELAFVSSAGANPTIYTWLAQQGTNIANTTCDFTLLGGASQAQIVNQQWIVTVTAGQYIQVYWSCSDTRVSLTYQAASGSPTKPASPSAIINVQFIPPSGQNLVVNSSTITGGTSGNVLYDNAGTVGEKGVTGTGNVVLTTGPTISNVNITSGNVSANVIVQNTLAASATYQTSSLPLVPAGYIQMQLSNATVVKVPYYAA